MNRFFFLAVVFAFSTGALASTDHYLRRDGGHVQHLKVIQRGGETQVSMDVDFDPDSDDRKGVHPCSVDISGEARSLAPNELVVKKQIENEARHCTLKIHLGTDSARVEQSEECAYYAGHFCKFDTEGQALKKAQ